MPDRPDVELAGAAAAGDGAAFAVLYDRYEQRIYTFALRLTGSREDAADATQEAFVKVLGRLPKLDTAGLNFGAYLYTAARHAAYDAMSRGRRAEPTAELEDAGGPGSGSLHGPPGGDLFEDPERSALLDSTQEAVRAANARLPARQREVLVLRELEGLSYDEIAEIMDSNRNTVAQLIFRARVRLRDELRGSALASVAASTPDCERAVALLAMQQDSELDDGADADWLRAHVEGCDTCPVAFAVMEEAGSSYRAWLPVAPLLALREDAFASVSELVGADWSELARRPSPGGGAGAAASSAGGAPRRGGRRGRIAAGAGVLCVCILLTGVVSGSDDPPPVAGGLQDSAAAGLLGARPASRDPAPVLGDVTVEGDVTSGAGGQPPSANAPAAALPVLLAPVLPPRSATGRDPETTARRTAPVRRPATAGPSPVARPPAAVATPTAPTGPEAAPPLEPEPAEPASTQEPPAPDPPRDPAGGGGTTPPPTPPRSAGP